MSDTHCPCGKESKREKQLLGPSCWAAAPSHLKQAYLYGATAFQRDQAANQLLLWVEKQQGRELAL